MTDYRAVMRLRLRPLVWCNQSILNESVRFFVCGGLVYK